MRCYWRTKLHPDAVHIADPDANRLAKCYTYYYWDAYPDTYGAGHSYAYGAGYGYAYRNAKLHTKLHIHNGDRNDRAGSQRHWKPLR